MGYNLLLTSHSLSSWDSQVPQTTRLFFLPLLRYRLPSPLGGPLAGHQLGLQAGGRGPRGAMGFERSSGLGGLSQEERSRG